MQFQANDQTAEDASAAKMTKMVPLSDLLVSDYEGDTFLVVEEHLYNDEVVTVGDGQWADEGLYAFPKPRPAARHVLGLVEEGYLERIMGESAEMEGITLSVSAAYVIAHTISPDDEFVTITLDRDDGYQVDLSYEAEVMLDKGTKEGLLSLDGKRPGHGRSL